RRRSCPHSAPRQRRSANRAAPLRTLAPAPGAGPSVVRMTTTLTVGALARTLGVSEKAVRLWTDRGLLDATRTGEGAPRAYGPEQVVRGRSITLLRALDVSLADVATVLDAADPVAEFDELWGAVR